jgi:hypothetical protein
MTHIGKPIPSKMISETAKNVRISHPPTLTTPLNEWIDDIVAITKTINKEAKKFATKYTKDCILKAVSKYH